MIEVHVLLLFGALLFGWQSKMSFELFWGPLLTKELFANRSINMKQMFRPIKFSDLVLGFFILLLAGICLEGWWNRSYSNEESFLIYTGATILLFLLIQLGCRFVDIDWLQQFAYDEKQMQRKRSCFVLFYMLYLGPLVIWLTLFWLTLR